MKSLKIRFPTCTNSSRHMSSPAFNLASTSSRHFSCPHFFRIPNPWLHHLIEPPWVCSLARQRGQGHLHWRMVFKGALEKAKYQDQDVGLVHPVKIGVKHWRDGVWRNAHSSFQADKLVGITSSEMKKSRNLPAFTRRKKRRCRWGWAMAI